MVEIESDWTGGERERMGILPPVQIFTAVSFGDRIGTPPPKQTKLGWATRRQISDMGRQIQFYALAEDTRRLYAFLTGRDPVTFTLKCDSSQKLDAVQNPIEEKRVMVLWNHSLAASLERKHVLRANGESCYCVDDSALVLEFSPSVDAFWSGRPALRQGRIYGLFESRDRQYLLWYESIRRWIRRYFVANPLTTLGGYIGPAAWTWFKDGGVLLPIFSPPDTPEWQKFIEQEHSQV